MLKTIMIKIHYDKEQYSLIRSKEDWCNEHIGKGSWQNPEYWSLGWDQCSEVKWAITSAFGNSFFFFKEERDATMFILRWGAGI